MVLDSPCRPHGSEAVFRILLSLIFLVAGANHLLAPDKVAAKLVAAPLAYLATSWASPVLLVKLAGLALVVGGLGLVTGTFTRWAAGLLMAVLIPITITVQVGPDSVGPLFKNIAIFGALVYFAANGASAFSIDAALARWPANAGNGPLSTRTKGTS